MRLDHTQPYSTLVFCTGSTDLQPIFSPKDFLEVLVRVKNPNFITTSRGVGRTDDEEGIEGESVLMPGLMKVQINVQSLFQLVSESQ